MGLSWLRPTINAGFIVGIATSSLNSWLFGRFWRHCDHFTISPTDDSISHELQVENLISESFWINSFYRKISSHLPPPKNTKSHTNQPSPIGLWREDWHLGVLELGLVATRRTDRRFLVLFRIPDHFIIVICQEDRKVGPFGIWKY